MNRRQRFFNGTRKLYFQLQKKVRKTSLKNNSKVTKGAKNGILNTF